MYTAIKKFVRNIVASIAEAIHSVSGGTVTPNIVTWTGVIMHIPVVWLIAEGYFWQAGLAIIFFGLFDALDGELARLQKNASAYGMFLDSVTDRIKEILIYLGVAVYLSDGAMFDSKIFNIMYHAELFHWLVLALGLSLLTTYINAWGEVVLANAKKTATANQTIRGGFAPYEIRITLLALGLVTGEILLSLIIISVLAGVTVIDRFLRVIKRIS